MTADAASDTGLPRTLGRYQIVAELGRGAMGTVFHGVDATIERPVALKTLNAELPPEILAEVRERFLREAKSAGQLNHPNIVTIYEFGQDGNTAFIAMEFLEGKSLQAVIREGRLPFATIADYVAQIADGLDYAHRFGVVHRDIKPANIMISPRGLAKLTDFGIARVQSSSMTQTGAMLGSPKYMSPEQVLGQPADGRADIFSLGVVLYEMLASRTPFETPDITVFSLMQRIVTVAHDAITQVAPSTPPAFEAILARALAKKPEQRYERAGQFAEDLRLFRGLAPTASGSGAAVLSSKVADAGYERTVATNPGGSRGSASVGGGSLDGAVSAAELAVTLIAPSPASAPLLADLDMLGASLEEMQRKFLEEEAAAMAAMRRKASKSKDWDAMAGTIEEVQPSPKSVAASTPADSSRKGGVFGLLRQQTGPNLKEQAEAKQAAEAASQLAFDAKLRSGHAFLSDFFREVNDTNPQYAAQHSLPFYGTCPPLYFEGGVVNVRTRRFEDHGKLKDIIDHMIVSYHLISPERRRVAVGPQELQKLKDVLAEHEMKYQMSETRNNFSQVTHAAFDVEIKFICALTLRADYTAQSVDIACRNIGPLGRRRYQMPASALSDTMFEELTKVMIGYPSTPLQRYSTGV